MNFIVLKNNIKESKYSTYLISFYRQLLRFKDKIGNIKYNLYTKRINNTNLQIKIKQLNQKAKDNNPTCYVIRRDNKTIGLMTHICLYLAHIEYAVARGYIPVIDMQSFENMFLEKDEVGKINSWEFYFNQPFFRLDEIKNNIIYSSPRIAPLSPDMQSVLNEDESLKWKILYKNFIRFNNQTNTYIQQEYSNLIKGKKVLGVLYRGTDYKKLIPKNHPITPDITDFINKIKVLINEWGDFDYIYVATEEKSSMEKIKIAFPGKIIENKRVYYDDFENDYLANAHFNRDKDKYWKGLEYLSSIYLLSRCNSFIGVLCGGTYAVNFMKEDDFEHKYFFYKGLY